MDKADFTSPWPRTFTGRSAYLIKPAFFRERGAMFSWLPSFTREPRLTICISALLRERKPLLGNLLCRGICPPSNQGWDPPPARDCCPLWPLVEVPPWPDPEPRPILFLFLTAPLGGESWLSFSKTYFPFLTSSTCTRCFTFSIIPRI